MALAVRNGKLLTVGGRISTSEDCCCDVVTGACCALGFCNEGQTQTVCEDGGGNYLGDDTTCDGIDCTVGGCCVGAACTVETFSDCQTAGGLFLGDGSTCSGDPCGSGDEDVVCCKTSGVARECSTETVEACVGDGGTPGPFVSGGGTCDPNPCGRCCYWDGFDVACSVDYADGGTICEAPTPEGLEGYWRIGATCESDPCEGSCCNGGNCSITSDEECTTLDNACNTEGCADGYAFNLNMPCDPNPCCPDPEFCQACCFPCTDLYPGCVPHWGPGCTDAGGSYVVACCSGSCDICCGTENTLCDDPDAICCCE